MAVSVGEQNKETHSHVSYRHNRSVSTIGPELGEGIQWKPKGLFCLQLLFLLIEINSKHSNKVYPS